MTNTILRLIFPFSNDSHNAKKNSNQITNRMSGNSMTNENTIPESDTSTLKAPKKSSQLLRPSKPEYDTKAICLLISDHKNINPIHNRNLLFQCALTVAANDTSIPTNRTHNGTVTIITPSKWEKLPDCYVLGMRISLDNIEQIMISNRIQFVYPKTYEELIMYLTSLHSTNQKNKTLYILENLDYFLSTNERRYKEMARESINDRTCANDTTINIHESYQIQYDKQGQMLTKLFGVIQSFIAYENNPSTNDLLTSNDLISQVQSNTPFCKFLINVTTSIAQLTNRPQQLKLYMWVDEVWVMSKESAQDGMLNDKSSKQNQLNRQHNVISCTQIEKNSFEERKLVFYYDVGLKSYVFKHWDVVS